MSHKLYNNGTEQAPSLLDSLISLIIISIFLGLIYFLLAFLTEWLATDDLATFLKYFYFAPFLIIFLYIGMKSRLPMLKISNGKLVTYKGVVFRDRVALKDIKQIETELNNDTGIQLIIHFKSGFPSNFTAEIPINSCDDGQFVAFMKKYAPEIDVITQTNILQQAELKATGLRVVSSNEEIEQADDINLLWQQFDFCKANAEYKNAYDILKKLEKRGISINGNLGEMYLNGWLFEEDETKAYEQFKIGINKGCALSKLYLAYMYMNGQEVQQSYEKALELFREIEDLRIGSIYSSMGHCLLELDNKHDLCKKYFLKAIATGDPEGYIGLGHIAKKEKKRFKSFCLYWKGAWRQSDEEKA